uniref:efflux RND transporter periplasmic adaptor subunit n=1 Tax=Gemmatimonas sp. TaxID=1962908 RepID=UPI00286E3D6A
QIFVREGQPLGAGAPLFKIDDAELRTQVARATAERDLAQQTLARTRDLLAQNASATADLERAEAMARSAQAQLDLIALRLARTTVRAPFAGVAGQRYVSLGDQVSPQVPLVSLQTTNPQRVVLSIPERYAAVLRNNQTVRFQVAAFPTEQFVGTVEFVDPVVALPARTIMVKALAQNGGGRLRPGMFAEARIATAVRPTAVVIPEDALMPAPGGGNAVWVIIDGKATRREITIGVRRAGFVEATTGVAVGEQVVVGGLMQLSEGSLVTAILVVRGIAAAPLSRGAFVAARASDTVPQARGG